MGYRIKEVRESKNMSQEDLASKSGISRGTISRLENGYDVVTTTNTLMKLAEALEVTIDQIFSAQSV